MSLLSRKAVRIGRAEREYRDDRFFVVATEDTYAPKQYFSGLSLTRVKVLVLETPEGSGLSAPQHVVGRLADFRTEGLKRNEVQDDDQFWVLLDTDHHIQENHQPAFIAAIREARQHGFQLAASNPSFELWLLLHHADVEPGEAFSNSAAVEAKLRTLLGTYQKDAIQPERFGADRIPAAIIRARNLEEDPQNPKGYWPARVGTRVYRLLEELGVKGNQREAG